MQSLTHTMAQRGVGAGRTNTRWHPYTPSRTNSLNIVTPHSTFRPTPLAQTVDGCPNTSYSILSPTITSLPSPHVPSCSTPSSSCSIKRTASFCNVSTHDGSEKKADIIVSLVDRTTKSLDEIWQPEYIPAVFAKSKRIIVHSKSTLTKSLSSSSPSQPSTAQSARLQLPSPITPLLSDQQQHASYLSSQHVGTSTGIASAEKCASGMKITSTEKDLVPIRGFVEYILRRARLSIPVLRSALCYLEAVRPKIQELHEREKQGLRDDAEDISQRISIGDDAELISWLTSRAVPSAETIGISTQTSADPDRTVNMDTTIELDSGNTLTETAQLTDAEKLIKRKRTPQSLPPLPPLPSPLLCPRRTFLAALILASKFLQDRCYSNRAWAKLSGLPPREVGRCERALGDALGWRLWVGKGVTASDEPKRSLSRSHSEGQYLGNPSLVQIQQLPSPPLSDSSASPDLGRATMNSRTNVPLRRSLTVPDQVIMTTAFVSSHAVMPRAAQYIPPNPTYDAFHTTMMITSSNVAYGNADYTPFTDSMSTEVTPKLSFSPHSMAESTLDTPKSQSSNGWSPLRVTSSNDVKGPVPNSFATSLSYSCERSWQQQGLYDGLVGSTDFNQTSLVWGSG